jgi:hypothetical protein
MQPSDPISTNITLTLSAKKITLVLSVMAAFLMLAYLVSKWAVAAFPDTNISQIVPFFDLDRGSSLPAFFNLLLLLGCTLLTLVIALAQKRAQGGFSHWIALMLVFMFLTLDAYYRIHVFLSALSYRMRELGWVFIPWIWVYAAGALLVGILFLRFLWQAPLRFRVLCIMAGILFVIGAAGFESLGRAWLDTVLDADSARYILLTLLEETCEFTGLIIFIYALLWYMDFKQIQIGVAKEA